MTFIAIPLILLVAVALVVSLFYIISIHKNKEKLALIEKGLNPKDHMEDRFFLNASKAGMLLVGAGLGFLSALLIDELVLTSIDNPAIYPACIFTFSGLSLLIYYLIFSPKKPNDH
jgi:hypothetical protein